MNIYEVLYTKDLYRTGESSMPRVEERVGLLRKA